MYNIKEFIIGLQLDTLRGWRVVLTVFVLVGSVVYAILGLWGKRTSKSKSQRVHVSSRQQTRSDKKSFSFSQAFNAMFADGSVGDTSGEFHGIDPHAVSSELVPEESLDDTIKQEDMVSFQEAVVEDHEDDGELELGVADQKSQGQDQDGSGQLHKPVRWKRRWQQSDKQLMHEGELVSDDQSLEESYIDEEEKQVVYTDMSDQTIMTEKTVQQIEQQTKSQIEWEYYKNELDYLKKKQQRDAYESKLIEGLAKDPEHVHLLEYLADFYMMDNQYKKALPLYKKLVDKDPNNHLSLWKMAQLHGILKDYHTAEVLLDTALTLHPHTPKYAMSLVELYYKTNRVEQALLLLEDVVKRRPENLSYHNALANLYEELELYDGAVQTYEAMLVIDPTNVAIKRKLLEARTRL